MKRVVLPILLMLCVCAKAREVTKWRDGWQFSYRHEGSTDAARAVRIPHTWNLDALAPNPTYLRTTGDYQRKFDVPQEWTDRRLFVKFHGVETTAQVFVNGKFVGEHRGGSTAFAFEITDFVRFGTENRLRVAVSNSLTDSVLPLSALHNVYGGIYRDVELIVTNASAISPLYLGTDGVIVRQKTVTEERVEGTVEAHLTSRGETSCRLTLEMTDTEGVAVVSKVARVRVDGQNPVTQSFAIERPRLWSPQSPQLYTVKVTVESELSNDEVTLTTGFRSISITPTQKLALNGEAVDVHGVALRYDRVGIGNALTDKDIADDFAVVREVNANALRSPSGPHAQQLYDLCDEAGVMVWIDLPFSRAPFLSDISYIPTPGFEENGRQQLREIIAQNMHHPSVVMWGIFDRIWMRGPDPVPYIETLNELAHKLDPSRPTVACSDQDGVLNTVTDLIVWSQKVGWDEGATEDLTLWLEQLGRNWTHLRSGITYSVPSGMNETRQTRFHGAYIEQLERDTLLWGVWVDLFDFGAARRIDTPDGVETTGLVTFDRRHRKEAFTRYQNWWTPELFR